MLLKRQLLFTEPMGQVAVTLNGRTYRLMCGPGEEPRLLALSTHVNAKLDTLAAQFGQVGDDRLMLMAALLITDELFDARDQVAAVERAADAATATAAGKTRGHATPTAPQSPEPAKPSRSAAGGRKPDGA